jgi:predicted NUDIX family phosphoesterase
MFLRIAEVFLALPNKQSATELCGSSIAPNNLPKMPMRFYAGPMRVQNRPIRSTPDQSVLFSALCTSHSPFYDSPVNENVLVVPTAGISPFLTGKFTTANLQPALDYILANESFRPRAQCEEDPSYKQIIPYVICRHSNRFLVMQRTSRQTEKRLHGKISIGIGGHINDLETRGSAQNIIHAGLERELEEEIHLHGRRLSLDLAGIISDDSTPVGQVHMGLVFLLETDSPEFTVNEPDLMTAEWATLEELRARHDRMETWSQIVLDEVLDQVGRRVLGALRA